MLLGIGWQVWRSSRVPLSDEDQIRNSLEDLRQAAESLSPSRVARHLGADFNWGGQSKSELRSQMSGLSVQFRDVTATVSSLEITVHGEKAIATGNYAFQYRPAPRADLTSHSGQFTLQLVKREGEWLIVKAEDKSVAGQSKGGEELF